MKISNPTTELDTFIRNTYIRNGTDFKCHFDILIQIACFPDGNVNLTFLYEIHEFSLGLALHRA